MDMQRPRQLFDCPEEIVEFIILDIPNPSDLLHLALACKALCKHIIPYHIQFRILKLGLGYVPGWLLDILTQHASLLSRYRTAEFTIARFSEYPLCLRPTASDLLGFIDYPYLDLVDVIWQSLSLVCHMTNLTSLVMKTTNPSSFLPILCLLSSSTPCLTFLELSLYSVSESSTVKEIDQLMPAYNPLRRLQHIRLINVCFVKDPTRHNDAQLNLLIPSLSNLEVYFVHPPNDFLDLFQRGSWPCLSSMFIWMMLPIDTPHDASSIFNSFFKRHPKIVALAFAVLEPPTLFPSQPWTMEIFPNLRRLTTNLPIQSVMSLPIVSQLTHVCGTFGDATIMHLEEMNNLEQCVAYLSMDLCDFLKSLPSNIQKLTVDCQSDEDGDIPDEEWISGLRLLRKHNRLTHLAGISSIAYDLTTSHLAIQELRLIPQLM
ncbi:hypothetical protein M422DRAFT_267377 [Sphaerobolus stellatus SS14]|uniref:F-box domain-containing protein n=1 Tax=Sphaerobolus stellatus (strain SS14) TaxID=990650 RepID=A0A0C9UPW1_SPHS4|nr:hypothetical protein M422DRAFT_267377 [Sphaerobolus stellatus SS14]